MVVCSMALQQSPLKTVAFMRAWGSAHSQLVQKDNHLWNKPLHTWRKQRRISRPLLKAGILTEVLNMTSQCSFQSNANVHDMCFAFCPRDLHKEWQERGWRILYESAGNNNTWTEGSMPLSTAFMGLLDSMEIAAYRGSMVEVLPIWLRPQFLHGGMLYDRVGSWCSLDFSGLWLL